MKLSQTTIAIILILALLAYSVAYPKEAFGMSPGTLDQLASTHVPSGPFGMNRRF